MRRGLFFVLVAPGAALLIFFFLIPLAAVSKDGFADGGSAFLRVLRNDLFWGGLRGTLVLAGTASVFSLVAGFTVALHLSRMGDTARTILVFFIALPLTFSGLIIAYGFILSYGRAGFITQLVATVGVDPATFSRLLYSPQGLAFASSYYLIPRVIMLLLPVLVNFDSAQFAAAESLGATRSQTIRDVLIPQILPTALTAFCLVAAVAIGAYGTALALVGTQVNILPLQLYSMISETGSDFPAAAALSLLLMAMCSSIIAVGEIFAARRERLNVQAR
jgi:putative spermidine/putrescine transport system permease protein